MTISRNFLATALALMSALSTVQPSAAQCNRPGHLCPGVVPFVADGDEQYLLDPIFGSHGPDIPAATPKPCTAEAYAAMPHKTSEDLKRSTDESARCILAALDRLAPHTAALRGITAELANKEAEEAERRRVRKKVRKVLTLGLWH